MIYEGLGLVFYIIIYDLEFRFKIYIRVYDLKTFEISFWSSVLYYC
jgi:hypothetical protein